MVSGETVQKERYVVMRLLSRVCIIDCSSSLTVL